MDALQGLSKLLTAECQGDGGRLALESRAASKRLEAIIAERLRDAHFKVVAAALRLLSGLVRVHPGAMAAHTSALLPLVRALTCHGVLLRMLVLVPSCASVVSVTFYVQSGLSS